MTDALIQKLEEKVITLLTELETQRKDVHLLRQENSNLKTERNNYTKKLQSIVSLLDSMEAVPQPTNVTEPHFLHARDEQLVEVVA